MTFQTIPINIAGGSYQDRSRSLTSQETRNFYQEYLEAGKDKYVIKSFPGQKIFGSTTGGIDRGQHQMAEINYRVQDKTLWRVASDGTHTDKGTINGTGRCIFADDGINLFIVTTGYVYHYDGSTVTIVTDSSIVGAQSVTFINNQFAYTFPTLTVFSDVGDGSSASSLNAVNEESTPDDLVRDYAFDQILYRFGKRSVNGWYNSGVGTPPFDKIEGQTVSVGLSAIHSVNNTRDYVYWLGSDNQVYRMRSGQADPISTTAISAEIQGFDIIDDAFGEILTIDNKYIYVLTFPSENKTWALNEELGKDGWFELSEGVDSNRYNAGSISNVYEKVLIGDKDNGNLYELDFNTYDLNGETWQRRRVISSINGDMLGQKGKRVQMSRLELIIESGTGLIHGQGDDPQIMIEASYDGGASWDAGTWMKIGRLGNNVKRAEWFSMKSFYDMIVRITVTDPVDISIFSGAIDLRLAGR